MPSNRLTVSDGFSAGQIDRWRRKLDIGSAIRRLNSCVRGELDLTTSSMKAIEVTLRKTIPDLASVDLTTGGEAIQFTWAKAVTVLDMTAQTSGEPDKQPITDNGTDQSTNIEHSAANGTDQPIERDTADLEGEDMGATDTHTAPPRNTDGD